MIDGNELIPVFAYDVVLIGGRAGSRGIDLERSLLGHPGLEGGEGGVGERRVDVVEIAVLVHPGQAFEFRAVHRISRRQRIEAQDVHEGAQPRDQGLPAENGIRVGEIIGMAVACRGAAIIRQRRLDAEESAGLAPVPLKSW